MLVAMLPLLAETASETPAGRWLGGLKRESRAPAAASTA